MQKRISILGIPIDSVTIDDAMIRLRTFAASSDFHHVMTPNPEMLVAAQSDGSFRSVLSQGSLNVPDGVGLLFAARFFGQPLCERVTGTDLVERIAAEPACQPVYFLGAAEGVAERAAAALKTRHAALIVAGTYAGSPDAREEEGIISRIVASGAKTLLVAYGAPAQDLWIHRVRTKLPSVRIAMGIGGAFDFYAGVRKRAPLFFQKAGLEWLWRLILEPSRAGRIFRATVVFPLLCLRLRFLQGRRGGT